MSTPSSTEIDAWPVVPRIRVVSDNDYAGDPDGLVQLAHLLLSPSADVPFIVSSHLRPGDPFDDSGQSAVHGADKARKVARMCGRPDVDVIAGVEVGLPVDPGPAAERIVAEAMRDDPRPLFVTCGGGLTEIANAWLLEPAIADRLTLVWIGGSEHPGIAEPPPGATALEYNTAIDLAAAQVVFNESNLVVWQVPRDVYRQALVTRAELAVRMWPAGRLGRYLWTELARITESASAHGFLLGEAYVLGDNPLVSLTALMPAFEPSPASSPWVTMPCPGIRDDGGYEPRPGGRELRVFTGLDNRLVTEDLYAKLMLVPDTDA